MGAYLNIKKGSPLTGKERQKGNSKGSCRMYIIAIDGEKE